MANIDDTNWNTIADNIDQKVNVFENIREFAEKNMQPGEVPEQDKKENPELGTKSYWMKKENFDTIDKNVQLAFQHPNIDQQEMFRVKYKNDMKQELTEEEKELLKIIAGIRGIVSSSSCGTAIGDNPHESREFLIQSLTNQIPPQPNENLATQHGHKNEDKAAQLFANKTGKKLFQFGSIPWTNVDPRISCSVDRVTQEGENVEIKCPFLTRVYEDEDLEFVLEHYKYYWHQMQLQMEILNLKKTYFVRYGCAPNKEHCTPPHLDKEVLSIVEVPRDFTWWNTYKDKLLSFIDEVETYKKEHPDWNDKRWSLEESLEFHRQRFPQLYAKTEVNNIKKISTARTKNYPPKIEKFFAKKRPIKQDDDKQETNDKKIRYISSKKF